MRAALRAAPANLPSRHCNGCPETKAEQQHRKLIACEHLDAAKGQAAAEGSAPGGGAARHEVHKMRASSAYSTVCYPRLPHTDVNTSHVS
jgi:hypothetical protein